LIKAHDSVIEPAVVNIIRIRIFVDVSEFCVPYNKTSNCRYWTIYFL